jgi:hypothetical protein
VDISHAVADAILSMRSTQSFLLIARASRNSADAARPRRRGDRVRRREFISLFGGMTAAWSLAVQAQESATMGTTKATTAVLPQIEVARVKPVDTMPPNLRLSDNLIDLMEHFSLSSAQGIGRAWGIPLRASTPFDERYGQW